MEKVGFLLPWNPTFSMINSARGLTFWLNSVHDVRSHGIPFGDHWSNAEDGRMSRASSDIARFMTSAACGRGMGLCRMRMRRCR
ncbi:hypothetical protein [Jiangella alkaliphila]|uniref:hypothetical protein n=1 Tax=Jiangella alkaliphila TaxID=419479 RepID=UPI00128AE792|nr:hypothetical protein [Jiangella alkaliphila]